MLTWQAHTGAVTSLAFVPGGGLLSTGTDGVLKHWDTLSGALHYSWKLAEEVAKTADSSLIRVLADATGRYAVAGLESEGVRFFDLVGGGVAGEFGLARLDALTPAPSGETVFCLSRGVNGGGRVWELRVPEAEVAARSDVFGRVVRSQGAGLAVAPDRTQVIADGRRLAWPSGEVAGPVTLATGRHFAVSPDGDKLFGVSGTQLVVWGLQTGALRRKFKGHVAPIGGLTGTPDGRKLWTASADATVRQWDVDSYRCETCYGLKIGPLGCVAVSPDGLTAAAGSAHNGRIAVWDLD